MNIIILGPPASGKGTQAEIISRKLGLGHIESGAILRKKAESDKRIEKIISQGQLVDDKTTIGLIDEYIRGKGLGYDKLVFDGFPRTESQYILLKNWLKDKESSIGYVIYLKVADGISVERISARRTCKVCGRVYNLLTNPPPKDGRCECGGELIQRDDDKPQAIKERLSIFHLQTEPVLALAKKDNILLTVDGEKSIDKVTMQILEGIK
jgi:adenylate kinase